ncbi:MAG: hypothetical protein E4H37_03795 [Gemmatimonadales bacterium]|nr:MAG: hypothetical protein E4H37_03795 [Gemmatimonadales bacterium]
MGEPVVVGFAVLAVVGLTLVAVGAVRRAVNLMVVGSAILLAVTGAWILGPAGAMVGLLAFGFLRRDPRS